MAEQSLLPAEPWYKSEVQVRVVIAIGAQLVSLLLRAVGRYTELSITTDMIDAIAADITQGVTLLFLMLAAIKRQNSEIQPLTITQAGATAKQVETPAVMPSILAKETK